MNNNIKIIVLHTKKLFLYAVIALCIIIALLCVSLLLNKQPRASTTSITPIAIPDTTNDKANGGMYTTTVMLNDDPYSLTILSDSGKIHNIQLVPLSESIATAYPSLLKDFNTLNESLINSDNIEALLTISKNDSPTIQFFKNAISNTIAKSYE